MLEKSKNLAVFGLEEGRWRWRRRRCAWYKRPRRATAPWEVVETSGGGAVAIRIMDLDFHGLEFQSPVVLEGRSAVAACPAVAVGYER